MIEIKDFCRFTDDVANSRLVKQNGYDDGGSTDKVVVHIGAETFEVKGFVDARWEPRVELFAKDRVRCKRSLCLSRQQFLGTWTFAQCSVRSGFTIPVAWVDGYEIVSRGYVMKYAILEEEKCTRCMPNFATLFAYRHGRSWHVVDNTTGNGTPFGDTIGRYFATYTDLCLFANETYMGSGYK